MSCTISTNKVRKWEIDYNFVNSLYTHLFLKNEVAGKFELNTVNKNAKDVTKSSNGTASTVNAPHAIVNWHSHPISCYLNEGTYYGWPSGEDLRETIVFGLFGSACHIVPSLEGTYKMQPNPCVLIDMINLSKKKNDMKILKNLNYGDVLRGIVIFCTECYFKITHEYRLTKYIDRTEHKLSNILKKAYDRPMITPMDFVNFANNVEFKHFINPDFIDYMYKYYSNDMVMTLSEHGERLSEFELKKISKEDLFEIMSDLENLGLDNDLTSIYKDNPMNNWSKNSMKLFKLQLYENTVNGKNFTSIENSEKLKLMQRDDLDIRLESNSNIDFYMFDMSGNCSYENVSGHIKKMSSQERKGLVEMFGSIECKFCKIAEDKIKKTNKKYLVFEVGKSDTKILNNIDYEIIIFKYDTIKEAIQEANAYAGMHGSKVNGIPSFFINGKLTNDYNIE